MDTQNQPDDLTARKFRDHCLLCGAEPFCMGIFVPYDPIAWGGCKGKARLIHYCLCKNCKGRKDGAERAEKIIRSELSGGGVTHAE